MDTTYRRCIQQIFPEVLSKLDSNIFKTAFSIYKITKILTHICPLFILTLGLLLKVFDEVLLHPADFELCREWNSDEWRETSLNNAKKLNIVPDDFDCDAYLAGGTGNIQPLDVEKVYDLGGLTVEIVPMPGHTSGQIGLLIREHRLLLTADACNPMMWMFLKWALSIPEWARMLEKVKELPFDYFLPAHIPDLLPKARMDVQIETARRANMADAVPMKHQPAIEGRPQAYVYSLGPISGDEQLEDIDYTAIYFIPEQLVDPEGNL